MYLLKNIQEKVLSKSILYKEIQNTPSLNFRITSTFPTVLFQTNGQVYRCHYLKRYFSQQRIVWNIGESLAE